MMKDQTKLYNDFSCFNGKCLICSKTSHLIDTCPVINYIPNTDFLLKKVYYSVDQNRDQFSRKHKKFKVLHNYRIIQSKAAKIMEKNDDHSFSEASSVEEDEPLKSPNQLNPPPKSFEYPMASILKSQKSFIIEPSRPSSSIGENSIQVSNEKLCGKL
jgi:hypothetical protein